MFADQIKIKEWKDCSKTLEDFFTEDWEVERDSVAENLGNDYGPDHTMTTALSSLSNGAAPTELQDQSGWYTQLSDLHFPDNEPSNGMQSDSLSLYVDDYFQENNVFIIDDETRTVQMQAEYCHDGHPQPPPSIPYSIDDNVLGGIDNDDDLINIISTLEQRQQVQEPQGPLERRSVQLVQGPQDDALLGTAEGDGSLKEVAISGKSKNICSDDEDNTGDDNQTSPGISKNLIYERKRRKRLNKQLCILRSMVPSITKMDKRSVLVDALNYLQDILDQTKIEIKKQNNISIATAAGGTDDREHAVVDNERSPDSSGNAKINHPPLQSGVVLLEKNTMSKEMIEPAVLQYEHYAIFPAITKMEAEKVDEQRYVVKIVFNKAMGAMGKVQRAVEMLNDFHCINVTVSEYDQHHMQSSNFLRVKKTKGSLLEMDEECLLDKVKTVVKQLGLLFLPPDPCSG